MPKAAAIPVGREHHAAGRSPPVPPDDRPGPRRRPAGPSTARRPAQALARCRRRPWRSPPWSAPWPSACRSARRPVAAGGRRGAADPAALPPGPVRARRSTPTSCGRCGCPGSCSAASSAPCWPGAAPPFRECSATRWPTRTCWVWPPGGGLGATAIIVAGRAAPELLPPGRVRRRRRCGHGHLPAGCDRRTARRQGPRCRSCWPASPSPRCSPRSRPILQQQHTQDLQAVYAWILGSLTVATWSDVVLILPYVALARRVLLAHRRLLDVLRVGEEKPTASGCDSPRPRLIVVTAATLGTAAAVAVSGLIGFVGIIVPHTVRLTTNASYRVVLPVSMIGGAAFLILADVAARTVLAPARSRSAWSPRCVGRRSSCSCSGRGAGRSTRSRRDQLRRRHGALRPPGPGRRHRAGRRPGEWVGLIGPNGAGKTTLLRAVACLVPHDGDDHHRRAAGLRVAPQARWPGWSPTCPSTPSCRRT